MLVGKEKKIFNFTQTLEPNDKDRRKKLKHNIMKTLYKNPQNDFELKIAKILGFTGYISQSDENRVQMIIDNDRKELYLSGTIAFLHDNQNRNHDVLLIATSDSEVNDTEITKEMLNEIINMYSRPNVSFSKSIHGEPQAKKCKIVLATNMPININTNQVEEYRKNHNLHFQGIGFSFCEKHNLEFTQKF